MASQTDAFFPKFVSARAPKPARESRALPRVIIHLRRRAVMENVVVACAVGCLFGCGAKNHAAEDTNAADAIKTPATVEQAARVLDLSTFPLMDGAKSSESRHVANLSYVAPGDPKKALEFHRKTFVAQGWKELPNSTISDESASAMFSRDGFVVSLSVIPFEATGVTVRLQNLGNVKPGKLPVPPNAKPVYIGEPTAMYSTEVAVACDRGRHPQSVRRARLGALRQGRRFRLLQTERDPRYVDCLVCARAGRKDHDPVFESANLV